MTDEEHNIVLERELADTRRAAVTLILGTTEGITTTPEAREGVAQTFEAFATDADQVTAQLARLVAGAIRRCD